MKKLRANRGQIRDEEGGRDVIDTKMVSAGIRRVGHDPFSQIVLARTRV
jgi:hypothetical protein